MIGKIYTWYRRKFYCSRGIHLLPLLGSYLTAESLGNGLHRYTVEHQCNYCEFKVNGEHVG